VSVTLYGLQTSHSSTVPTATDDRIVARTVTTGAWGLNTHAHDGPAGADRTG
jgi:hypothetical protein